MLTPLVRLVSSRTRSLNRRTAFGAIRRFGSRLLVKLNPRNLRSHGRATALFCWFTLSLSFVVMNAEMLAITRSPARRGTPKEKRAHLRALRLVFGFGWEIMAE